MEIDNTTYEDLSLFQTTEEFSIFTNWILPVPWAEGISCWNISTIPSVNLDTIRQTQQILRIILDYEDEWPPSIQQRHHHGHGTVL